MKNQKTSSVTKKVFERSLEDQKLKQQILDATNLLIPSTVAQVNRKKLIVQLRGGDEISFDRVFSAETIEYEPKFPKDYYLQIKRLIGIPDSLMDQYRKPRCVAIFTNRFVYGRFGSKVLEELKRRNPYIGYCEREFKHFQKLSISAQEKLEQIIFEVIECMRSCETYREFKFTYSEKYNISNQLELFEGN